MASVIRSLPVVLFAAMVACCLGMAAVMIIVAMRVRLRARLIAATPTSFAGFAKDGYVEFEGTAQPIEGHVLQAPLTRTPCVWYHATLEHWRKDSDRTSRWFVLRDVTSDAPFFLQDTSGVCIVYPSGAEVTYTDRSIWFGSTPVPRDTHPARVTPGESAEGLLRIGGAPGREYRYTEERIYARDPLYVLGEFKTAAWEPDEWAEPDPDVEAAIGEDEADARAGERSTGDDEVGDEDGGDELWQPYELYEAMSREAARATSRRVERSASNPFLLSTTPQARLQDVQRTAWKGSLALSIVPIGIAAALCWLRFG